MRQIICLLKSLHCHHCDERDGDELFIKYNGRKIWPEDKKFVTGNDNCVIPINLKLLVDASAKVILQLWDYDLFNNDLLGEFYFIPDEEGQFKCDLKTGGSVQHKFTLEFTVSPYLKKPDPLTQRDRRF